MDDKIERRALLYRRIYRIRALRDTACGGGIRPAPGCRRRSTYAMRKFWIIVVVRLLAALPLSVAQGIGTLVGLLFYWLPNRERRNGRINLKLCYPGWSAGDRERLLKRSLVENAKTLAETPGIWLGDPREWVARIRGEEGSEILQELLNRGRGVIVAAPHLGNWEAGVHYLASVAPVTALYRPPREPALAKVMQDGRSRGGARLVPTSGQGVKALYAALRRGEMVTILPDQQPKSKGAGVFAPFFGVPALTMVLVSRLARKTGAAVIFSFAERLPAGRGYRTHWVSAPPGIADADPVIAASALNLGVETCVRRCPEQYQWSYKRFEERPAPGAKLYTGKK